MKKLFLSLITILALGFCMKLQAQLKLTSDANVGIGTNYPENSESWNKVLNVYGQYHSKIITTTSSVHTGIWSHNSGYYGAPAGGIAGTFSNHPFSIITNKYRRMVVLPDGRVGINQNSPAERLHVYGNIYISGQHSCWIGNNSDANPRLRMHNNGSNAYIDYYNTLYLRSGPSYSYPYFTFTSSGNLVIGRAPDPLYKLDVNGSILVNSTVYSSDSRLKENMKPLSSSLDKLLQVKSYSYNYKSVKINNTVEKLKASSVIGNDSAQAQADTTEIEYYGFDFDNRTRYGFNASEIKEIFPDVVYEGKKGYLGIDYIAFIPMLLDALKEQNSQINSLQSLVYQQENDINELKKQIEKLNLKIKSNTDDDLTKDKTSENGSILFQNTPNPFDENTQIDYYLAENTSAGIYIYDMNGAHLKNIPLYRKGYGNITIKGGELQGGMYMYALIAGGKVIDTKRMILT